MAAGRADYLNKRLTSAGLSQDAISRYLDILRRFLTAKLTKIRFEDEMAKVLPRDKIHVHNGIIRELLQRAHMKREGVPDVPVIAPVREKRSALSRKERHLPASGKNSTPNMPNLSNHAKTEPVAGTFHAKPNAKRKREDFEHDPKPNGTTETGNANNVRHKIKGATQRKAPEKSYPNNKDRCKAKVDQVDKTSLKRPKLAMDTPIAGGTGTMGPPTANGSAVSGRTTPAVKHGLAVPSVDVRSYDSLVFQPVQPGQAMDIGLFRKLRMRMRSCVEREGGLGGVKDEAVGLVTHAVEKQVKKLLEAAVRQRISRERTRPSSTSRCHPVTVYDMREAVLRDLSLLGSDAGLVLERLSMLL